MLFRSIDNDIEVIIRGKNISEELSIEKSATWIISDITSIASTDIEDGTIINFKLNRNETGDFNEKILLKSDNFFSEFYLRGNFYNTVKGLPATDIYSYEYKKAFTANWSCNYPVSIDVYTKNDDVKISVAGFPKDNISENSLEISSLNANTTYYYQLTANDVTSEEIAVTLPSITPTISFDYDEINFTTVPNRVSFAKLVSFKTTGLNDNIVCSTVAPFELSIDNKEWSHDINVPYTNGGFYIRLGNCDIEEELETELFISHESIEDDIIINLKGDVNREKSFVEGFEFGIKGSYAVADVYCDDARWRMTSALIGTLDNDQKNGKRSVRLHLNSSIPGVVELLDEKTNGIDSISFFAGTYGTDAAGDLSLEYTQDNGVTWKPIVSNLTMTKVWTRYSYYVGVNGNVRIRFTKDSKSKIGRAHV